ncbi:MAG: segregation/condensation protein A, partial [Deltaproteobacteria bacterium]|nr:segregation/condensation protein A [Deltaproteobacteria bacterium]
MTYQVKLDQFEGPLDLLLHLIRKNEMDIRDIEISKITDQYLNFINAMRTLDVDLASEFIVMAATLIYIKSKMLLPKTEEEVVEEELDPREALAQRL